MLSLVTALAFCVFSAQAHGYGNVLDVDYNGHALNTAAYGYAPAIHGHGGHVNELKSDLHYVDSRGAWGDEDHGFYASNVVEADAYAHSAYVKAPVVAEDAHAPSAYVKAPVVAVDAYDPSAYVKAPVVAADAYAKAPVVAVDAYAPSAYVKAPVVYADAPNVVYGQDSNAYGYDLGHNAAYDGRYRFSGRYSPVTAGHYIGYGNKYGFRQGYPYGYGEMLSYTAPVGYSLKSGYNKLETKQPAKYSYAHGYVPLTPVHYKNSKY